jgi:pantothenate synthetase
MPDTAYFGQKDAQQVAVVKQLVRDLNVALEIRVIPIVRDAEAGTFSRNARLSTEERARALAIPRAIDAGLRPSRPARSLWRPHVRCSPASMSTMWPLPNSTASRRW